MATRLVLTTLALCLFASAVRADAADEWVLIPALAAPAAGADLSVLTTPIEDGLREKGREVLANEDAALMTARSSSDPAPQQVRFDELLKAYTEAVDRLALGQRKRGAKALEAVLSAVGAERNHLTMDARRAQRLYETCLLNAHLLQREGQNEAASAQAHECIRLFPTLRPGPAPLAPVFEAARARLAQRPLTTLVVRVKASPAARQECVVSINGVPVGNAPATIKELVPGYAWVQMQCGERASRMYGVQIHEGRNELAIDATLDAALRIKEQLWLEYPSTAARAELAEGHAAAIAKAAQVGRPVVLWVDVSADKRSLHVRPFLGSQALRAITVQSESGFDTRELANLVTALHAAAPAPASPPVAAPALSPRAKPVASHTPVQYAWDREFKLLPGAILGTAGAAALVAGWALYGERQDFRRQLRVGALSYADLATFSGQGTWALTAVLLGSGALSAATYFLLPPDRAVPAWSWAVGGVGVAGVVVGIAYALEDHCGPQVYSPESGPTERRCQSFTADALFGPLLAISAAPLVAVPLSYMLRREVRMTDVRVYARSGGAGVSVSWSM